MKAKDEVDVTLEVLHEGEDEFEGSSVFYYLYTSPWSHKIGLWIVKRVNFLEVGAWKCSYVFVFFYLNYCAFF